MRRYLIVALAAEAAGLERQGLLGCQPCDPITIRLPGTDSSNSWSQNSGRKQALANGPVAQGSADCVDSRCNNLDQMFSVSSVSASLKVHVKCFRCNLHCAFFLRGGRGGARDSKTPRSRSRQRGRRWSRPRCTSRRRGEVGESCLPPPPPPPRTLRLVLDIVSILVDAGVCLPTVAVRGRRLESDEPTRDALALTRLTEVFPQRTPPACCA
jgi:hypothetical protein